MKANQASKIFLIGSATAINLCFFSMAFYTQVESWTIFYFRNSVARGSFVLYPVEKKMPKLLCCSVLQRLFAEQQFGCQQSVRGKIGSEIQFKGEIK